MLLAIRPNGFLNIKYNYQPTMANIERRKFCKCNETCGDHQVPVCARVSLVLGCLGIVANSSLAVCTNCACGNQRKGTYQ